MKQILTIILLTVCLITISCQRKKPDEVIIGKWVFSNVDMANIENKANDGKSKLMIGMVKGVYESMKYEFFLDKTFESSFNSLFGKVETSGKYELIHDGKKLLMSSLERNNEMKEEQFEIISLTSDSLIFSNSKGIKLTFSKINK